MRMSAPMRGLPFAVMAVALVVAACWAGLGVRGGGEAQVGYKGDPLMRPAQAQEMEGPPGPAPAGAPPAAEAPTPEQIALVEQAVAILRTMMTPDVPPPPPLPPDVEPAVIERAPRPVAPEAPPVTPDAPSDMPMMDPGMPMDPGMAPPMEPGMPPMDPGMAPPMEPGMGSPGASLPPDMQPSGPGRSREYRIAQADVGPPVGPPGEGPGDMPGAPEGPPPTPAATGREMTPVALALALKDVCQKTRGIQMTNQKWFHEYWYFMATGLLKEVAAQQGDFAEVMVPLVHAAQVKSDWEGYMWHWAVRAMLAQDDFDSLKETAEVVAKARTALAAIRAISHWGLLMQEVDRTKLGRLTAPTIEHVANCVQFSFGNPNYDPAGVERDETLRSRLMVEVFDNYYALGHNWQWERSRNWAYLSRVTNNLPAYTCDSCGQKMTRDGQMWRCSRCGKGTRPAIPGTLDAMPTHECLQCGYKDQYRVKGIRCPACGDLEFSHRLEEGWNAPTFQRSREGLLNAQHLHTRLQTIFAEDNPLPTQADREAYENWLASSPRPEWVPPIHTQELVFHEERLRRAATPSDRRPQTD